MDSSRFEKLKSFLFYKNTVIFCVSAFILFSFVMLFFQCRTERVYHHRMVLESMGIMKWYLPYTSWQIESRYKKAVHFVWVDEKTGQVFRSKKKGRAPLYVVGQSVYSVAHYAFPFVFQGAYAPIEGVMAVAGDGSTMTGVRIFRENELGLGEACGQFRFVRQFRGKRFADDNRRFVGIKVVAGNIDKKVPYSDVVHTIRGISGALLTNTRLEAGLVGTLERYEGFSSRLRGKKK